uniref:Peptidase_M14 domain-containing protein n=1 Tax=Syphacia muris TaxID=451379 RepID=A0A0N5AP92_9BILA
MAYYVGDFADVMLAPTIIESFKKKLQIENMRHMVIISDVQNSSFISVPTILTRQQFEQKKIFAMKTDYKFGSYRSYRDMLKYIRTIEFYYPNFTKVVQIGLTHENQHFRIGNPLNGTKKKRGFWIDANIHAREWASSHTAVFFINQLVGGYGKSKQITKYVNNLDFYIFPCLNPDGYEYSRSSSEPQIRLWRKNRSTAKCIRLYGGQRYCCNGVDLNRNFDFHWAETGTSNNPCSNIYHGEKAFSEPETNAVNKFLTSTEMTDKLDGFITLHTYAQLWIHPFSHKTETYPNDLRDLKMTARRATARLKSVYGTKYRVGTGADLLSSASGGSDDWAKSALGVKYVYLIELRPKYESANGFIMPENELMPTAIETWEGIKEVIETVMALRQSGFNSSQNITSELD